MTSRFAWRACALVLLASSAAAFADTDPTDQAYPYIEMPPSAEGGQPYRELLTTNTSYGDTAVADRILVSFVSGLTDAQRTEIHQLAAQLGAGAARPVLSLRNGSYLVDVSGAASVEAAAAAYRAADSRVLGASPDGTGVPDFYPNDARLNDQMGMFQQIAMARAWDRSRASGVRIAILDTGIDESHPDLAGKVDDRINVTWFRSSTGDNVGHGTFVAGLAAATANNALGIAGIGYDARLLNVKIGGSRPTISAAASGIYWAVDHGADVISMSFGFGRDCNPWWIENWLDVGMAYLRDAVDYAWSRNVILVAAAGNSGGTGKEAPAACPHVVAVASVDSSGALAPSTTRGNWVTIAAPGVNLLSTSTTPDGFMRASGTSVAAPIVSGVLALMRASCGPQTNQATIDRLLATVVPMWGNPWSFGHLNAGDAVCVYKPTGLRVATAQIDSLTLAWNERSLAETHLLFEWTPVGSTQTQSISLPPNTSSYTVRNLPTGVMYNFQVRACDAGGCSDISNVVTARANAYRLAAFKTGYGRIISTPSGINCSYNSNRCSAMFAPNPVVTLTATPLTNPTSHDEYDFDHWEGDCTGDRLSCTLTMDREKEARAVFKKVGNSGP
jgi:thermitase